MTQSRHSGFSRIGTLWNVAASGVALVCLDAGRPDHLGPFRNFVSDELAELSGRARKHSASQIQDTRGGRWQRLASRLTETTCAP